MKNNFRLQSACQVCFLAVLLTFGSAYATGQTVYDLGMIDPDVTIIGSEEGSSIDDCVLLDIDHSGQIDLFLYDAAVQPEFGDECVFGYLDIATTHGGIIDIAKHTYDVVIVGTPTNHHLGHVIATGDWNNDGIDDLALGDQGAYNSTSVAGGLVYVFWGGSQWTPGTTFDLAQNRPDIFIHSSNMAIRPRLGSSLATLDVNNDGIDDLAIGASTDINMVGDGAGAVHVLFGSAGFTKQYDLDVAQQDADLTLHGKLGADHFGISLASGDINGDQVDDLLVGSRAWHWDSEWLRLGALYAFWGSAAFPPNHHIDLSETEADVTVRGSQDDADFSHYIVRGDFNGDGLDDMCASEYVYFESSITIGAAYLFYGQSVFPENLIIDLRVDTADISYYGEFIERYFWVHGFAPEI